MRISEIMTKNPVTIDKDRSLKDAVGLLIKHKISRLPVLDNKKLVAILTHRDITEALGSVKERVSSAHIHVSNAMSNNLITLPPSMEIQTAAETMVSAGISGIPIVDGGKLVGIITKTDLIGTVKSNIPVSDIMAKPIYASPDQKAIHIRRMLIDYNISILPVLETGKLMGTISEKDIAIAMNAFRTKVPKKRQYARIDKLLVQDIMRANLTCLGPQTTLKEAAELLLKKNIGGLPVLDQEKLVGIVTKTDIIRAGFK